MSREKLEEQMIKNLKHIKLLRKQNQEYLDEVKRLEDTILLLNQENEKLNNGYISQNASPLSLKGLGKTLSSMFDQKKCEFSFIYSEFSIEPEIFDETPQYRVLKTESVVLQEKLTQSLKQEHLFKDFSEKLQKDLENRTIKLSELQESNQKSLNEIHQIKDELIQANIKCKALKTANDKLEEENKQKSANITNLSKQLAEITDTLRQLQMLNTNHNVALEQFEKMKAETIEMRIKVQDSDRQIEQLRESLKKSMRSDKEKDETIHILKSKLKDLDEDKNSVQNQVFGIQELLKNKDKEIAGLKQQIIELNERIVNGVPSQEAEIKTQKMSKMLEKSNSLYSEVREKATLYENRVKELEILLHNSKKIGKPRFKIILPDQSYVLFDNGLYSDGQAYQNIETYTIGYHKKNASTQMNSSNSSESDKYVTNLMKQYFVSSDKIRVEMSPVIMRALGFSNEEINSIASPKKGFFSFV